MRKLIIISLFLALFFCNAYSADEGNIYTYFVTTPNNQTETLFLNYDRNVEMDGKNYQQYVASNLYRTYADSLVLLRKEDSKYFYYDSRTSEEKMLFDFSLQKGDTFTDDFSGTVYNVVDVRDSLVNDSLCRLIEIRDCEGTGKHDIWMEDVGSIYTGILPKNKFRDVCLLIYFRFCYSLEENVEHSTYFYPNTPLIKTAGMSVMVPQWDKEIEPEEDWDAFLAWLHAPTDLNAEFENDTLHVWGKIRTSCSIQSYAACELSGDKVTFMAYPYNNLLDADCISTYIVETRIPGFEKGKYKINLYNKTIELVCAGAIENAPVAYTEGQMATIVLPTEPDASKGKYYRLDRVEGKEIVFEQELQPKAHVPYIIVPSEDFSIELGAQEVEGLTGDTVSVEGVSFIGTYHREEINPKEGFSVRIIDTTPDCSHLPVEEQGVSLFVGALRAYLLVHWDDPYNPGGTKAPAMEMEIVLKDNPNSIRTLSNSPLKGEDIYDLSGRKLSTLNSQLSTKKKAIYIQNNRKLVK